MRRSRLITALLLLPTVFPGLAAEEQTETIKQISLPPASIAQWYKPSNERQVWLHTMFSLRRSMLAVTEYSALEDQKLLQKWAQQLVDKYLSIPKMVPEWADEVEDKWAMRLLDAAKRGEFIAVQQAQRKLATSCRSCHNEYRAVTAALYRSPDFSQVLIEDSETLEERPYDEFMASLTRSMNRVKIAMQDGRVQTALGSAERLDQQLNSLGTSCEQCHRDDPAPLQRILGQQTEASLTQLKKAIDGADLKGVNQLMAEVGVGVCARCHGVHRTLSELRKALE